MTEGPESSLPSIGLKTIYTIAGEIIKLPVAIKPQAKQNKVLGLFNGMLKIAIAATPVDGKANKELISFLAKILRIKKQEVAITQGLSNHIKLLQLPKHAKSTLDEIISASQ